MEDGDTGDCIDTDGCADGNGNDVVYGTGPHRTLAFRAGQKKKPKRLKQLLGFSFCRDYWTIKMMIKGN